MDETEHKTLKQMTIDLAVKEGVTGATIFGSIAGAAVFAANKYSPWFRTSLGISGKVGTVMMAITGSFFLFSELALIDAQRHPEAYGFEEKEGAAEAAKAAEEKALGIGKKIHMNPKYVAISAANHLYDHPFQMLISLSVPIIGWIFYEESKKPGLKLSQRIIHTRVQGQASVILILALTMGFRDYMHKKGGRIPLSDDDEDE